VNVPSNWKDIHVAVVGTDDAAIVAVDVARAAPVGAPLVPYVPVWAYSRTVRV
jgi:hypothetical protein